jgi:hypothetical protein
MLKKSLPLAPGYREKSSGAGHRTSGHSAGLSRARETHKLLDDLAEATIDGPRKEYMELLVSVALLIIDDLGMRKLPVTAAEDLLEIVMRRYERASTLLTRIDP